MNNYAIAGLGAAATPTISVGTKLSAIGGVFTGTVIARGVDDGKIIAIAKSDDHGDLYQIDLQTMKDGYGDKWTVVVPEKTEYVNVYDDGTFGTPHDTHEGAAEHSKYYKTRVGILTRVLDGHGNTIRCQMNSTTPQYRSPLYPHGMNPYAKG